jgi:pilus assembly protein CpaE
MDFADRVLVVTTPDLASLHDASRFIRISQTLAYPSEKILLILNKANLPGGVKPKEIKSVLHWSVFAEIPEDTLNATRSLNRGIPIVLNSPRSPLSRSINDIAKHFTDSNPKLTQ